MAVRRDCMRSQIRQELIRRIVDGVLRPGDKLVELQIAREFRTSQGPVREALRELETLRLVECEPFKGTRVRAISEREQAEAAMVRGLLEEAAAQLAADLLKGRTEELWREVESLRRAAETGDLDGYARHNLEFHRRVMEASGNAVMLRVWDSLMLEAQTRIGLGTFHQDIRAAAESHAPIVEALEKGDGARAGQLLRSHAETLGSGQTIAPDGSPASSKLRTSENGPE